MYICFVIFHKLAFVDHHHSSSTTLRLINLGIWQLNLYIDVLFMTRGVSFQASDHKHRVAFVAALRAVFKTVRAI